MPLTDYRTLGRSGLVVSPLALSTMTFGAQRWGSDDAGSRAVFNAYVEAGGNFIDTADVYTGGQSEDMLGGFMADRQVRHKLVLATKAGFAREAGSPHAGGNGAKNIYNALEGSLRHLRTDYVDLFWVHVWDRVTPAEEVLLTLGNLVQAGTIRYFGLSNIPAWYMAQMATLARAQGVPRPVALQCEYSLVERSVDQEYLPAAYEFGMGVLPWSPLAGGFLAGKYDRKTIEARGAPASSQAASALSPLEGRLSGSNPFGDTKFNDRNWRVLDVLRDVAREVERPPAQVALAWALQRPCVASVIIGASRPEQVADDVASVDLRLTPEQLDTLDQVSAPEPVHPHTIFTDAVNRAVFGGMTVERWR